MKFPDMDQKSLIASLASEMSLEVAEETLLILQESQKYFLFELVVAVPRWMFSDPDLLQKVLFVNLRLEK